MKIHPRYVDELLQNYRETKTLESCRLFFPFTRSYRLQFLIAGISDLLYDRISTADEESQAALLSKQVGCGERM